SVMVFVSKGPTPSRHSLLDVFLRKLFQRVENFEPFAITVGIQKIQPPADEKGCTARVGLKSVNAFGHGNQWITKLDVIARGTEEAAFDCRTAVKIAGVATSHFPVSGLHSVERRHI